MTRFNATWSAGIAFAAGFLVACGGSQLPGTRYPGEEQSFTVSRATASLLGSKLAGETFSSSRATSSCSGNVGSFHASGKARGPFPGSFTARGTMTASASPGAFSYHERFTLKSGSASIAGSAEIRSPDSGSPVFGCSKSGQMAFDAPIIFYRAKPLHAHGAGSAGLSGSTFDQDFQ